MGDDQKPQDQAALDLPSRSLADESRARIEKRIKNVKQLFEWDEIDEVEYSSRLTWPALLPDHDKMRSFDEVARVVASLPAALDAATADQAKQLIAMVVEEVTTKDRVVHEILLRSQAMPFFAAPESVLVLAPPDGFEPPTPALGRLRSIH